MANMDDILTAVENQTTVLEAIFTRLDRLENPEMCDSMFHDHDRHTIHHCTLRKRHDGAHNCKHGETSISWTTGVSIAPE